MDILAADALVERLKSKVNLTYDSRVKSGIGGFAAVYQMGDRYLAASTDGVGTKIKLAQELGIHHTVGIDLVAMCVNDLLCVGARPLFFMDYLACGKIGDHIAALLEGVQAGCEQAQSALIGGETAEMPGCYGEGEYDLAGFAVGELWPNDLLDGLLQEGNMLIGLPSSGLHSNGFSLIRKLVKPNERELKEQLLTPTVIYWEWVQNLLAKKLISGMAHITGGGFLNINRMGKQFDYHIENDDFKRDMPEVIKIIAKRSQLPLEGLHQTFNMGIGLILATADPSGVLGELRSQGKKGYELGRITKGTGKVFFKGRIL